MISNNPSRRILPFPQNDSISQHFLRFHLLTYESSVGLEAHSSAFSHAARSRQRSWLTVVLEVSKPGSDAHAKKTKQCQNIKGAFRGEVHWFCLRLQVIRKYPTGCLLWNELCEPTLLLLGNYFFLYHSYYPTHCYCCSRLKMESMWGWKTFCPQFPVTTLPLYFLWSMSSSTVTDLSKMLKYLWCYLEYTP